MFTPRKILLFVIVLGISTSMLSLPVEADADSLRVVAYSGSTAPGTTGEFSKFGKAVLNSSGQIAFTGTLSGASVNENNDEGVWSEGEGGPLTLVARSGSVAPGSNENFHSFKNLVLNGAGGVAFVGRLTEGGAGFSSNTGIWSGRGDSFALLAQTGSEAPGTSESFSNFRSLVLNDVGQTAFRADLTGDGVTRSNEAGIWSERNGSLALVARKGSEAPGTSANFTTLRRPALNAAGQTVFGAGLIGLESGGESEVNNSNNAGIWSAQGGAVTLYARTGTVAPGTDAHFSDFTVSDPVLNELGEIAFRAGLSGEGVGTTNDKGTWTDRSGTLALVGREGDSAPGTPAKHDLLNRLVLNRAGQMAFLGRLIGDGVDNSNNHVIWTDAGGSLELLARQGSPAPETNGNFLKFDTHFLNDSGQAGFVGSLRGTELSFTKNSGIWAQNLSGELKLIVQKGDQIDVDDGPAIDLRTINRLTVSGSGTTDDRRSGFNNRGQLAFRADFTDGTSGIFVSNLVAVPEPSSLVLLLLAGLVMIPLEKRAKTVRRSTQVS